MQAMFKEKKTFKTKRNIACKYLRANVLKESQRLTQSGNLALFLIKGSETSALPSFEIQQ